MNRLLRIARALLLPLVGLAGLALLSWGVLSYWQFYRELYLEEVAAIEALAGEDGVVEYRRQGEATLRQFDATKPVRERVPWSVPFVGRVESTAMIEPGRSQDYPSEAVRDRVLRLPGMRAYADPSLSYSVYGMSSGKTVDDFPLGSAAPTIPQRTRLRAVELVPPLPEGESVSDSELATLRRQIYDAWAAEPSERPRMERWQRYFVEEGIPGPVEDWNVLLVDGERRFRTGSGVALHDYGRQLAHLVLQTDEDFYALRAEGPDWRTTVLGPRDLLKKTMSSDDGERPFASDPHEVPGLFLPDRTWELLGVAGEGIERIGRIDDERYRISARPVESPFLPAGPLRLDAIVRRDRDWGIERYEIVEIDFDAYRVSCAGVVRLARVDGEAVIEEALRNESDFALPGEPPSARPEPVDYVVEQIATVFDPVYSRALLDPRTYEADLPYPRSLPAHRLYRYLPATGAVLLLVAIGGELFVRARRAARSRSEKKGGAGRRFSLQFGLATLLAAALLVISFAGWFKRHLDDAREQLDLLAALSAEGARVRVERVPPAFPWAFVSTDALPMGAPLKTVAVSQPPPPNALDRLLRVSPAVTYVCDEPARAARPEGGSNSEFFGHQLAAVGERSTPRRDPPPTASFIADMPHGQRLTGADREAAIEAALQSWRNSASASPERYAVLESASRSGNTADLRMTFRDGHRSRFAEYDYGVDWVDCRDGRFLRRFAHREDLGWRLVLRRPLGDDELAPAFATLPTRKEVDAAESGGASFTDATGRVWKYGRPVVPAGLPRAPYGLPPCLANWAPPLDQALSEIDPEDVVVVETLDERRVRFDVDREASGANTNVSSDAKPTPERLAFVSWSVVALPDLDWAIERCEYVDEFDRDVPVLVRKDVPFPGGGEYKMFPSGETRKARLRRTIKILNQFERDGERLYVDTRFDVQEREAKDFRYGIDGGCRYRIDAAPDFPDAVFDRATVDDPAPPLPEERYRFPWYLATAALSGAVLVVLGARRTMRARRSSPDAAA